MATRTSTRATKAVKFVDSAGSDDDEEEFNKPSSTPIKSEGKKPRGRPSNARRNRSNDDEDWDARNERIDDDDDVDDEDNDDDNTNENGRDVTKKFQNNRTTDSVYDFR